MTPPDGKYEQRRSSTKHLSQSFEFWAHCDEHDTFPNFAGFSRTGLNFRIWHCMGDDL
jgi:hypothetical protein